MWTKAGAYEKLQEIYTDQVMQEEKRRVFQQVYSHLLAHLDDLQARNGLKEDVEKQLKLFKEYTFMPGDNLFQSMRYIFLIARGERVEDRQLTQEHVQRVYRALFKPAGLKTPQIPDSFWHTPLGVACLVAEKGVEKAYPILDEVVESEQP